MQPSQEFVHIFWRQNQAVHFRIYHVEDLQCVQWWYDEGSGTFNVHLDIEIRQNMTFDGSVDIENKIQCEIELPEIPSVFQVSDYLSKLPTIERTNINTDSIKTIVDICEEATSPMRLERELKLHRTKKKLRAVYNFKCSGK